MDAGSARSGLLAGLAASVLLTAMAPAPQAAGFTSAAAGATGAEFLNIGIGARAIAMGEAHCAAAEDAFAIHWNPAAITRVETASLGLMHAEYLAAIRMENLSYARKLSPRLWLASALTYVDIGAMEETDPSGATLGSFRPRAYMGALGLATRWGGDGEQSAGFALGASAKPLRSEILGKAQTVAFDLGALAPCPSFSERGPGSCALVVQNLGAPLGFEQQSHPLPTAFKLGWAFSIGRSLLISAEAAADRGNGPYGALGLELLSDISPNLRAAARLGANSLTWRDVPGLDGVSAGLGIRFHGLGLDYALAPFGELGLAHRASLTLNFGRAEEKSQSPAAFWEGRDRRMGDYIFY